MFWCASAERGLSAPARELLERRLRLYLILFASADRAALTYNPLALASAEAVIRGDSPARTAASGGRTASWDGRAVEFGLGAIGAALGASQVIHGAYNESTWAPIALGALALVLALTIGVPRRPSRAVLIALASLLGLWLWSLISSGWSGSSDAAHVAANRWLLYAAAFAVLWWMVGNDRRRALALLGGVAAGVLGVAVWMVVRMLGGHGPALFLGTRLNDPLGYVNGQAGYLLVAVWPCLALTERRGARTAALAGLGMSGLVILVALGLLTQSRSWGIGLIVSALLVLAAIPGRRRRVAVLVLAAATIALLYAPLSDVWRHPDHLGVVTAARTRHAAKVILLGALAAGVVWALALLAFERGVPVGSNRRRLTLRFTDVALGALILAAIVALAVNAGAISHRVHNQYEAFVHLGPTPGGTRFFSGGGNRYDYWRVAMVEFRSEPIRGVGAGGYDVGYYLHRRTTEPITQPHSLELQTLAELGLVGGLLLLAFLGAVALGFVHTARAARASPVTRAVAVAAGGAFAGWLVQTSVDWMHLFPGLTAIALAAAVALLARPAGRVAIGGRARIAAIALAAAIACAGAITIAPRILSLDNQQAAEHALGNGAPKAAITDASRALDYDSRSVQTLVLRAAGFARLQAFAPALADLKRALAVEPRNWVTWALLGDLLTRRGERLRAHSAYERALALNPLEPSLRSAVATNSSPRRPR